VDEDMKERIRIHQARRDAEWGTYEGYRGLGEVVRTTEKTTVLLDCVTVMITNILFENEINFDEVGNREIEDLEAQIMMELSDVIKGARDGNKTLILVTNEVGMSIVPSYRLGRIFSDIAGKANQFIASLSDEVYISISGVPLRLK
jgi:adenosylcobinamide kinase/adenosylcobinamide-phosphate guanylyltransferase